MAQERVKEACRKRRGAKSSHVSKDYPALRKSFEQLRKQPLAAACAKLLKLLNIVGNHRNQVKVFRAFVTFPP